MWIIIIALLALIFMAFGPWGLAVAVGLWLICD